MGESSSLNSLNVLISLWGDSKKIVVLVSFLSSIILFFLPFLCGRKPSNINLCVGSPLTTTAGTNEVGPGRHSTSIFFFNAMLIKEKPGSDIKGVPASETKAISSSSFKFSIILGAFLFSL